MQGGLDCQLQAELDERAQQGLKRATLLDGQIDGVDFGSNDYLGLARDPIIAKAMVAAVQRYGVGGRSARLLSGGSPLHEQCERSVAAWLGSEAALLFPSGYQANVGLLCSLVGRGDAIISDRDNHASLIDAARLSRARILVHDHLDLGDLERALRDAAGARRRLVVTEGVFSMEGDTAPLLAIERLCREYDAWLIVDEAHSVGLLGPEGAGAWAQHSSSQDTSGDRLCARVVTGGKALGVAGAFVVGSQTLRDQLIHKARSFLFTTAPPPALAGALLAAVGVCRQAEAQRAAVFSNAHQLAQALGLPEPAAAIVPVPIGDAAVAAELATELKRQGFYAPSVRPPTVAHGASRLRLVCHAKHSSSEIADLAQHIRSRISERVSDAVKEQPLRSSLTCVVGTDTDVGKTVVSAILLRAAISQGPARYWKPVQTGDDDDTASVAQLAAALPSQLLPNLVSFPLPASPHAAAAAAGSSVDVADLQQALDEHRASHSDSHLLLEFAGGLLVPFALDPLVTQADWLTSMGAQVVLVARAGLGTLNHTMLTIEAMRRRNLKPAALFLVGEQHRSNSEALRAMSSIQRVYEVPHFPSLNTASIDAWLDDHDITGLFRV